MSKAPEGMSELGLDPVHINSYSLEPHTSSLPDWLYILSFSPKCPSPVRDPRGFISNPTVLYVIGTILAIIAGVGLPAFDIVFGHWADVVAKSDDPAAIIARGKQAGWIMTMVAFVFIAACAGFLVAFTIAGAKLSNHVREKYLASIIVQDQAFFDRVGAGEVVTRSSRDIASIRTGLGERLGYLIWSASILFAALISAFVKAPKLAGVLFSVVPFTGIIFLVVGHFAQAQDSRRRPIDDKAASFIEQMLTSVRVVQAFDMAPVLLSKLEYGMLRPLLKLSRKVAGVKAVEQAASYLVAFIVYSISFWYGGIAVQHGTQVGDVLVAFYNYVNMFFSFTTIVPHLIATMAAVQKLGSLRLQIERKPPIDVRDPTGLRPATYEPGFGLEKVTFAYPARPESRALDNVSIIIEPGSFTAFAGPSGSGKSTSAALLLRLYDPRFEEAANDSAIIGTSISPEGSGVVRFAGHDVKSLNLAWLRTQVAVVQQNPQLVSGTVFENVAIGLTGTELEYRPDSLGPLAEQKLAEVRLRVEEALKIAQAWTFVSELPKGLDTVVSSGRTGVLSGGQIQRVALARALVRRPRCLLLDEATSAVSADAELKIQQGLSELQQQTGMTLVVIAHRLSTIVAADKIVVMKAGRIVSCGTFGELTSPGHPDATFRDMAAGAQSSNMPLLELEDNASQEISGEKSQRAAEPEPELPPPMRSTGQAFLLFKWSLTIGVIFGLIAGAAFPIAGWLHGRAVQDLSLSDLVLMRTKVDRWALWFLVLALASVLVFGVNAYGLEFSGEGLVSIFRRESARAVIRQDITFFETAGGSGGLTAAVAFHPSNIGNVVGVVLAQCISSCANLIGSAVMSFVLGWRVAVMMIPTVALSMLSGLLNTVWLKAYEDRMSAEDERQACYVADSINTVQLIATLTRETETMRLYRQKFTNRTLEILCLVKASIAMGVAQSMLNLFAALVFWWGARQRASSHIAVDDLFTVVETVIVSVFVSAKLLTYSGDFVRMRNSLVTIQSWIDREPETSKTVTGAPQGGPIEKASGFRLSGVQLRYPSRPDVLALDGVDLHLELGKSYAFCGSSGAGKSSILALLQRFYEPSAGMVSLDGVDIRTMDVAYLRAQMGYVSQEPVLFEGTIRWNLLAGALDPSKVTHADLVRVCEQACILDFIQSLPDGFETDLGLRGGRLSGGQRQRLCIARAMLRQPRILLLDEATSALDGKSEAHVQQALDNAARGRLTVTIGHRLSSIRGADVIFVMEKGAIVESGSHDELIAQREKYYELVEAQL